MSQAWLVRAGGDGSRLSEFLQENLVAIGFGGKPDLSPAISASEVKKLVPHERTSAITQLVDFRVAMLPGHMVVTFDPHERVYHVGHIIGDYYYRPEAVATTTFAHARGVKWNGQVHRDALSDEIKRHLERRRSVLRLSEDAASMLSSLAK